MKLGEGQEGRGGTGGVEGEGERWVGKRSGQLNPIAKSCVR